MDLADAHASNLDVIWGIQTALTHASFFLIDGILDFSAELWVLVEIGEVWPFEVDPLVVFLLLLFNFLLLVASGGVVMVLFSQKLELCLCFVALLQHFWGH